MVSVENFVDSLWSSGVDFFTGVPDSLLKNFCACATDHCGANHVITANEGGAVGLASGHYLATGKMACVYMQNSGQGNAVNPLASLADPDVYSILMLLLVGWRGMPGVHDEPQHVKQGKITLSLFETLGIPTSVLPDDEAAALEMTAQAVAQAKRESRPVALVVKKGLFADYKLENKMPNLADTPREEVIEQIVKDYGNEAVFVSTKTPWKVVQEKGCGWWVENDVESLARALREMMALSENDRCEMGNMGCTPVSYTHLTLPTRACRCRSRWSPYH